jgi:hypothetical protein
MKFTIAVLAIAAVAVAGATACVQAPEPEVVVDYPAPVPGAVAYVAPEPAKQPAKKAVEKRGKSNAGQEKAAYAKAAKNAVRAECVLFAAEVKGDYYVAQGSLTPLHPAEFEVPSLSDSDCVAWLNVRGK